MRNPSSSSGTKTPCCSKVGIKKGPWTPEEDEVLSNYIKREGEGRWRTLPKRAGLLRCGKSCRLRWMNYLRPSVKRGRIAPDEEDLILRLHRLLGNRWSLIAGRIPGRTDNEIKNYWNTHLSKKLISQGIDPRTHKPLKLIPTSSEIINEPRDHHDHRHLASSSNPNPTPPPLVIEEAAGSSHQATNVTTNPYQNHEPFINNDISMDSFMFGLPPSSHVHEHNRHEDYIGNYNEDTFSSFLDSLIINDNVFMNQQHEQPPPPPPPNMVASSSHHVIVSSAQTNFKDGTSNWDSNIVSTMAVGDHEEQQRAAEAAYDLSTYTTNYNTY